MTLASKADILLDDDEFVIDKGVQNHYAHRFVDLTPYYGQTAREISGSEGGLGFQQDTLLWSYTDWAGGEGNRIWYNDQADRYMWGEALNPRLRGQLTVRPKRHRANLTGTDDCRSKPIMTVANRAAWIGGSDQLWYSTDGDNWTKLSDADSGMSLATYTGHYGQYAHSGGVTAMTGDSENVYWALWADDSSGSRTIIKTSTSGSPATVETEGTNRAPIAGMCMAGGYLFAWTGRRLYKLDITNIPVTLDSTTKVYDTGVDPVSTNVFGTKWFAECIATENSVIFWYASDGRSHVYEYKFNNSNSSSIGQAKPIWDPPLGFTLKGSCYQNGEVYFSGHWGGDSNATGWGALYKLPLSNYNPIHLDWVRKLTNNSLQMQTLAPSYGKSILVVAERTGRLFVYDADADGLTMLDWLQGSSNTDSLSFTSNDNRVGGAVTWGNRRIFTVYRPGAAGANTENYQVMSYEDDEPDERATGFNLTNYPDNVGTLTSAIWDYDFPMEQKVLNGFHVTFAPLTSGQFIDISYSTDYGSSFTSLTQITSSTSGASAGRVYIPVSTSSSTKKFVGLQFRVKLTSNTGVAGPILYNITAEARLVRKREEWELIIRMKDENSANRPRNRELAGSKMRDWLEATVKAGNVVTFRDGFRYKGDPNTPATYSTHTVIIKEFEDVISQAGEGSCRVLLVAVPEAT